MLKAFPLVLLLLPVFLLAACDTHCISETETLWDHSAVEYRLELTNNSPFLVELTVDGEVLGTYCSGVNKLSIGTRLTVGDLSEIIHSLLETS